MSVPFGLAMGDVGDWRWSCDEAAWSFPRWRSGHPVWWSDHITIGDYAV